MNRNLKILNDIQMNQIKNKDKNQIYNAPALFSTKSPFKLKPLNLKPNNSPVKAGKILQNKTKDN